MFHNEGVNMLYILSQMDEFESPALEALPFEEISDDCPPTPESSDSSDVVSTNSFNIVNF